MENQLSFSFGIYSRAIASTINDSCKDGSFVVGITGPWGSGKTTLLESVHKELGGGDFVTVRFNAWAHSKQDAIWRGLFVNILSAIREDIDVRQSNGITEKSKEIEKVLDDAERALYSAFTKESKGDIHLDASKVLKGGAKLALKFVPWGDVGSGIANWLFDQRMGSTLIGENDSADRQNSNIEEQDVEALMGFFKRDVVRQSIARIESIEQFRKAMEAVLAATLNSERKLLVLVDDVDRCLPEQGLEVFEAIKLYLDLPSCVFMIAMDRDMLQYALDIRYGQASITGNHITAEQYTEKMVDLTFSIPNSDRDSFKSFAGTLGSAAILDKYNSLISGVLPRNPRTWQRFSARIQLHKEILTALVEETNLTNLWEKEGVEAVFVKLQLLNFHWPAIHRSIGDFASLVALELCIKEANVHSDAFVEAAQEASPLLALQNLSTGIKNIPKRILPFLNDISFLSFLAREPDFKQEDSITPIFEAVFTLDSSTHLG